MRKSDFKVYGFLVLLIASCLPSARAYDDLNSYVRLLNGFPNVTCNFENDCTWRWSPDTFSNVSAADMRAKVLNKVYAYHAPSTDADKNENG